MDTHEAMETQLGKSLKSYRLDEARKLQKPAFHVFNDKVISVF